MKTELSTRPNKIGTSLVSAARGEANRGIQTVPHAPSIGLSLRFILLGLSCLVCAVMVMVFRPEILATYHYNQFVIAVTHLLVLGWICSVVIGAMYQLVPVALETHLFSERIGRWQFALHLAGVAGMVAMFWIWDLKQVGLFGSLFGLGVLLFAYNIGRTLARVPRWNVIATAVASALFWLVTTMFFGLFLAASKSWPISSFPPVAQMHAHAHLGVVGVFVMMIVGVSYKLVPMFTLSEVQSECRARWSIALLNAGVAGAFTSILLQSRWKFGFALFIVIGLCVYGIEMFAILRARKRRQLDWGMRYFLLAVRLLVPVSALALFLSWPELPLTILTGQLENVYGFLAIVGVLTLAIVGMLYKIVPFLVWYSRYSCELGRSKVPSLAELYSSQLQKWGYWCYLGGLLSTSAAIAFAHETAVRLSCGLLGLSLVIFGVNLARILSHLVRPRIESLPLKAPASTPTPA